MIKVVLNTYEVQSGQAVNYQKSGIFFSANVRRDKQREITDVLGVSKDLGEGMYLGLPSLVGRSKKSVFKFIKKRVWKKIQCWNNKILSRAGKSVMIKNVAQSVPTYCMSCFMIPKSLCQEIERMMNSYWWCSNNNNNKGIRWLVWERMCVSKIKGVWGFEAFTALIWLFWANIFGISCKIRIL